MSKKTLDMEQLYDILHNSTGIHFMQSTGLAIDPSWSMGITTHMVIWNEGVFQIPTYEEALKMVFDVKPEYGHGINCNDHAFRDRVKVVDYCLNDLAFEYPPAYGIMYVFPAFGRKVTHCANIMFHQTPDGTGVIVRANDPQNTRSTFELDRFIIHESSDVCTVPHLVII
jgi:hypothetical protein